MGILFNRKEGIRNCDICNNSISGKGGAKLGDGVICVECNNKVSPYLSDLSTRSVSDVSAHLRNRDNNYRALENFVVTKVLFLDKYEQGAITGVPMYLDEQHHKFLFSKNKSYKLNNPDIFDYKDVRSIIRDEESSISASSSAEFYTIKVVIDEFENTITEEYSFEYELPDSDRDYRKEIIDAPSYKEFMQDIEYAKQLFNPIIKAVKNNEPIQYVERVVPEVQRVLCPYCGAATSVTQNRLCEFCGLSIKE